MALDRPGPHMGGKVYAHWKLGRLLWSAALANGWKIRNSILPTANFTAMAAAAPGQFYANRLGTDPLFDM